MVLFLLVCYAGLATICRGSTFRIVLHVPQLVQKYKITDVLSIIEIAEPKTKSPRPRRIFDFPVVPITSLYLFSAQTLHTNGLL